MTASPPNSFPPSPCNYKYPGPKWWKMDFHTHTPASDDYANGEQDLANRTALKEQSPEEWLTSHMAAGLDAVVVTDHNSTGFISSLQSAYSAMERDSYFRPLVIFLDGDELKLTIFAASPERFDPTL